MMDPLEAFRQASALTPPAFPTTSRYYGIATAQLLQADGRTVVYVQRRFLPQVANFAPLAVVQVVAGDRLDNIAALRLGDPLQWWRIADANGAMQPEALVATVGASLTVALPEGVPAPGSDDGL